MRREPNNPADPQAVAVFSPRGVQIGYLTAERCGRIGALIRDGVEIRAVFQVQTPWGCWIRATFDGSEPVVDLHARAMKPQVWVDEYADPEPEFEPDPIWDD